MIKMKKLASLVLAMVMCVALAVPATAAVPGEIAASAAVGHTDDAPEPRLPKTTTTLALIKDTWSDLVTDNNYTDKRFTVETPLANPGGCIFRIKATDGNQVTTIIETSGNVNNGSSWISRTISFSYKSYTVQVKVISTPGSYTFTYHD